MAPRQDLFARAELMARGHAEALMPMVAEVMAEAGVTPSGLDLIAATLGPGSFTGVRIAIAAARGLALATGAKLWGTDSLTVMARAALAEADSRQAGRPFAVAVDARRSMLYFGLFDAAGARLQGPVLIAPEDAAALLPDNLAFAVGSGAELLAQAAAMQGRRVDGRSCPTCNRTRRRSPRLPLLGARPCPPCARSISVRLTPSRRPPRP